MQGFHIHLSALDALKTFIYVLILGTFWRIATFRLHNTSAGKAMAVAY